MTTVYVLELENNKYYIGETKKNIDLKRMKNTSEWTKIYKPISIIEKFENGEIDKTNLTRIYMKNFGIDNVRGGAYCSVILDESRKELLSEYLYVINNNMSFDEIICACKQISLQRTQLYFNFLDTGIEFTDVVKKFSKIALNFVKCPICRNDMKIDKETIKIKGQLQDCCVCMENKAEILCKSCSSVNICYECVKHI